MILGASTRRIRAYLSGAPATTNPDFLTAWADHNLITHAFDPDDLRGALNGTTPVEIIPGPATGFKRQVKLISIYNRDTAGVTVLVESYDGTDQRRWVRAILQPDWSLQWEPGGSWKVYDNLGIEQAATTSTVVLTVEDVDGVPSYPNISIIQFDQADGFVVSQPVTSIARIDSTGSPSPDQEARLLAFWRLFNGRGL